MASRPSIDPVIRRVATTLSRVRDLDYWGELRTLIRLATPIAISQMALGLFGLVDTAVVGRYSTQAMAGTALGNSYVQVVSLFAMGLLLGLDPLISQRLGANEPSGAWRVFKRGAGVVLILVPLCVIPFIAIDLFLLRPNLGPHPIFGQLPNPFPSDPEVTREALGHLWWRFPGLFGFLWFTVFRAWLFSQRHSMSMIWTIAVANILNFFLDWALVFGDVGLVRFGLPAIGLPAMSASGAAIATSISNLLMPLMLLPAILKIRRREVLAHPEPEPPGPSWWQEVRMLLRIGFPIGCQITLEMGIFAYVLWIMTGIGNIEAGAHQVAIMVASFTFLATVGIGAAASVEVGRFIGAGQTLLARKAGLVAISAGAGWMLLTGIVLVLFPTTIAGCFTEDPKVRALAAELLRIAAAFQIFDGIQSVASGALRGAGDTRIPFFANLVAYWIVALPVARWLAFGVGMQAQGLWWGLTVGLAVVSMLLLARFLRLTRARVDRL